MEEIRVALCMPDEQQKRIQDAARCRGGEYSGTLIFRMPEFQREKTFSFVIKGFKTSACNIILLDGGEVFLSLSLGSIPKIEGPKIMIASMVLQLFEDTFRTEHFNWHLAPEITKSMMEEFLQVLFPS